MCAYSDLYASEPRIKQTELLIRAASQIREIGRNSKNVHLSSQGDLPFNGPSAVWPEKNCQMFIKVAQNDFTRKVIYFDTFTKIA